MVRDVRNFVRQTLARVWALLLRSMPPATRGLARRAERSSRQYLSPTTTFTVASVVVAEAPDVPDVVRQAVAESQKRFSSGALLGELSRVGDANAVMAAHISERGAREAEHFITIRGG
ncbi:MAG TPA: hypothetical protein VF297_02355 [Pyrinomonadaceae bacterium]